MRVRKVFLLCLLTLAAFSSRADSFSNLKIDRPSRAVLAPTFTLQNLKGEAVALSDFDDGVVLLNFWATFCSPCIKEMPAMERLWQRYKEKGFTVLAVTVEADRQTAINLFAQKRGLGFPILFDKDEEVSTAYEVSYLPVSYLIQNGKILGKTVGAREWDGEEARGLMEGLLK